MNFVTTLFVVCALTIYENVGGIDGVFYVFVIFTLEAIVSIGIEKYTLKNQKVSLGYYIIFPFATTALLIVINYIFVLIFGGPY